MVEKEFKILLTENQYKQIVNRFAYQTTTVQVNYYYDTENFQLEEQGITLRIREKNSAKLTLQFKKKEKGVFDYSYKQEFEKVVDRISNKLEINNLSNLPGWPNEIELVFMIGKLKTIRKEYSFEGIKICLDKNIYLNKKDYEIEIEFDEHEEKARNIIKDLNLQIPPKIKGKYKRFVTEYTKAGKLIGRKN